MKCNVLGWLLGLPIIALIWGLAIEGERAQVIEDLERRTSAALAAADLDWARARFDVTEGRLIGAAYSSDERQRALAIARRVWGVWHLEDATNLVAEAPDYLWGAAITDSNLYLTGHVPNEKTRRQILQAARQQFPQRAVRDDMRPARGVPSEAIWIDGVNFGLRQLVQLKKGGRVDLRGTQLGVSGEAESVVAYRAIKGDISRRIPSGITLAQDNVTPPRVSPFTWHAKYTANQLEIDGHVTGAEARGRIVEIAKEVYPKAAIVDKMAAASGAPERWLDAVGVVLRAVAPLELAEIRMSHRSVIVTGEAEREITSERVLSALKVGLPDQYRLDHKITFRRPTLPTVSPFTTTLVSDGETVSLTGYVPDEASRRRLLSRAQQYFGERPVVDALSYGNGAPVGWLTCIDAAAQSLAQLDKGRAELSNDVVQLTGETRDEKLANALPAQLRAAANRACKDTISIDVKAPPEPQLKWQAEATDDGRLILSGDVIDSDVMAAIQKRASTLFPKREIVSNMRVRPGRSIKWPKVVAMGIEQLARLRSGIVKLDGLELTLRGVAPDTAVATQAKARIERAMIAGYVGLTSIEVKSDAMIWSEQEAKRKEKAAADEAARKVQEASRTAALREVQRLADEAATRARADRQAKEREAQKAQAAAEAARRSLQLEQEQQKAKERAAQLALQKAAEAARFREEQEKQKTVERAAAVQCKNELNETVRRGIITFDFGSDRLTSRSVTTLDKLIATYRKCPGARLEIGGHTDSLGSDAANERLSKQRAESVLNYFVTNGLPRDRFVTRGYGKSRPKVANTSAANRALNRRIEFDVMTN